LLGQIHNRALSYTKSQFCQQVVTVATDPQVGKTDDGHLRAYVYIGGFMYNSQLLRIGYARVTDSEFSKRPLFREKMQTAQQKGYGVCSANQPR
jgi:endonuclease YncB( thermonuclease family)